MARPVFGNEAMDWKPNEDGSGFHTDDGWFTDCKESTYMWKAEPHRESGGEDEL